MRHTGTPQKAKRRRHRLLPKSVASSARLYFLHGDLDHAASWLRTAAGRCPTSHRIWTHVCLLQQELNDRYRGDANYVQEALGERAAAIARAIKNGTDAFNAALLNFWPPPSPAASGAAG